MIKHSIAGVHGRIAFPVPAPANLRVQMERFTSPGDTVLGIGVETTHTPEVALGSGRRLELYLSNPASAAGVRTRMDEAFLKSYNAGLFHVSATAAAAESICDVRRAMFAQMFW